MLHIHDSNVYPPDAVWLQCHVCIFPSALNTKKNTDIRLLLCCFFMFLQIWAQIVQKPRGYKWMFSKTYYRWLHFISLGSHWINLVCADNVLQSRGDIYEKKRQIEKNTSRMTWVWTSNPVSVSSWHRFKNILFIQLHTSVEVCREAALQCV